MSLISIGGKLIKGKYGFSQLISQMQFIQTESGNRISRKAVICGAQQIVINGKSIVEHDVILRGDLHRKSQTLSSTGSAGSGTSQGTGVSLALGRYCIIKSGAVLRPPCKQYAPPSNSGSNGLMFTHYPLRLGDWVYVGEGAVVEAASIGSNVYIGSRCHLGKFCIVKDGCYIQDGAHVPPFTVLPPLSRYPCSATSMSIENMIGEELPGCFPQMLQEKIRREYDGFLLKHGNK